MMWNPDEHVTDVYDHGKRHGRDGKSRKDNPELPQSEEWKVWDWGWLRGLKEWLAEIRNRP